MFHDRMPRSAQDSKMESTEVVIEMNIPKEAIGKIIGPKGANKATLEAQIGSTFKVVDVTDPAVITFEGSMEICESLFRLLVNAIKPQFSEKDIQVDIREKVEVEVLCIRATDGPSLPVGCGCCGGRGAPYSLGHEFSNTG